MEKLKLDEMPFTKRAKEHIGSVIHAAKMTKDGGEELIAVMHLINSKEDSLQIIGAHFNDDRDKNAFVKVCKEKAKDGECDMAIFVSETWMIDGDAAEEFIKNRQKYPTVSSHPKARDTVVVHVETPSRLWLGTAVFANGKLGEMLFVQSDESDGRFTGVIPRMVSH